jgi:hypothetical protein
LVQTVPVEALALCCFSTSLDGRVLLFFIHARPSYLPAAVAASSHLHEQLARGEEAQIYANADPSFQMALSPTTTVKFFARIRRKLGPCQYSGPTTWSANADQAGTFVTVVYHDQCANGSGDETLRWKLDNGAARLVYNQRSAGRGAARGSSFPLGDSLRTGVPE